MKTFMMKIEEIQPSQLYINKNKLDNVLEWFNPKDIKSYNAIPIKKLKGGVIFTDGHTRAYVAYLKGVKKIKVYFDEDSLDWEAYDKCVQWCIDEDITIIGDLNTRVINNNEYNRLWINKCKRIFNSKK